MNRSPTVDELNHALLDASGRLAAMEFVVNLILMTHPNKDRLQRLWDSILPEQIDRWSENHIYVENSALRSGAHGTLALMRNFIDKEFDKHLPD